MTMNIIFHCSTHDDDNNNLTSHLEPKITTIAACKAERVNLHEDEAYSRLSSIDILIFGRSGVGKSCLLKAITNHANFSDVSTTRSYGDGRMNSHIVSLILKLSLTYDLTGIKTPIAYFITNIYNYSNEQPQAQIDGELSIMRDVYLNNSTQKTKYYYEMY
ncbi:unnamed protein product [Didymodactylos carnosus]|uniref:Uncharacterized protein n=1 Tax=Didymodactylos carnosus TaxID=1234261 RepID=A0A814T4D3_9BILA|nr:unnamed protein product [Didymodactylos carnosus]CAF3920279.1 unnamed protein product [Didymodactylos carnosus]